MPCFKPLSGFKSTGSGKLTFQYHPKYAHEYTTVPCGNCIGCRIDRSRSWAIRCVHEAQMHDENCFITLTYDQTHLPQDGSLKPRDFQLFMKKLRRRYQHKRIRYFQCGEYGEKTTRPHYHACIFGLNFQDLELWSKSNGVPVYRSKTLEKLWPLGMSTVGTVTWQSAGYVARYIMKKINGPEADDHYVNKTTGEVLHPEYTTMSRKPGIGYDWFQKYWKDIYPGDYVVINGTKYTVPRYYDKLMEEKDPQMVALMKEKREKFAKEQDPEHTSPERLKAREQFKKRQVSQLKRQMVDQD